MFDSINKTSCILLMNISIAKTIEHLIEFSQIVYLSKYIYVVYLLASNKSTSSTNSRQVQAR